MDMLISGLIGLVAFVGVLGLLVLIHEFGHYAVAKLCGVRVEVFSLGFGPRLIGFRRGDTDYRISALPLGGYVKMSGENPVDTITGDPREFLSKPKWQRFLVASAGPIMNIVLAFVLLTGLLMHGMEVPEVLYSQAVVGFVKPDSPAAQAGIQSEDRIARLDNKIDPKWQDVSLIVGTNAGRELPLVIDRKGQKVETTITPSRDERDGSGEVGMGPVMHTFVRELTPGYPAVSAGVQVGDEIVAVNGVDLRTNGKQLSDTIQSIPEPTFPVTVLRNGTSIDLPVTPVDKDGKKMIGVIIQLPMTRIKLGVTDAISQSVQMNADNAVL